MAAIHPRFLGPRFVTDPHRALWVGAAWTVVCLYWWEGGIEAVEDGELPNSVNFYVIKKVMTIRWHGAAALLMGLLLAVMLVLVLTGRPFCRWRIAVLWLSEVFSLFTALTILGSWWLTRDVHLPGGPVAWFVLAVLSGLVRSFPPLMPLDRE